MSAKAKGTVHARPRMPAEQLAVVLERRRSGAAGTHGRRRPDRRNARRRAIEEAMAH
jgi:hypothetical protein